MTTSQDDTSKCLSGILRRLLCTGSLPTHPSESISTEPNNTTNPEKHSKLEEVIKPQAPPTPGIVARLMGLDTLPDFNPAQNRRTLDSMLRSRSVNSVNCLPELDLTQFNHRRVRTSVSFREENATFSQQRESDFVVFRFEKVGGSSKWGFSGGKSEMGLEEPKQGKVETDRKRGDLGEKKFHKKVVVSEREKGKNYRANRRFSTKVDNVNSPYKSIYEMGLEELVEKEVETERNRGDSGDGDIQKKKKKKVVGEREKKNYRVNQRFSSKVDVVNLPYTSISDMKLKQSEVVERVDLIGKKKVVRGKTHETLKGKSAGKALNHKEILVVVPKYRNKEKSICRHKAKKVKPVCNSKNSSPVSVLDLHNVLRHTETASSGDSRVTTPTSMKLSLSSIASSSDQVFVGEIFFKEPKKTREALEYYHSEVLSEIFRLTEEGIEESKWIGEKVLNFEEVEEICIELGHQILDLLLGQVIHEQIDSKCMTCMP
ncbi:hypothetical protein RHGRI_011121 [Rhododendron griersonianum]|uniref:DUF3741 domain-containing protein n=1 Tax=Rhododendron griersonianum TaxID=479676 RepID=A0AAV6KLN2_9ERIC|nr:hypothetical protein RHGRI_011121 [Rhododendron griersonianum]